MLICKYVENLGLNQQLEYPTALFCLGALYSVTFYLCQILKDTLLLLLWVSLCPLIHFFFLNLDPNFFDY